MVKTDDGNAAIAGAGVENALVELGAARIGDANLDGTVSDGDYAILDGNFGQGPGKRTLTREPFIDHDAQGILITGRTWMPLELLGS